MANAGSVAKWLAALVLAMFLPGLLAGLISQISSFVGLAGIEPIPDIGSTIDALYTFSRNLGFILVVGGSLGIILSFKSEELPVLGTIGWYIHLVSHELIHALMAKLCGYRIKEFKLTKHGGYVAYFKPESKGNFLISLGPYLFPLVPLVLLVACYFSGGILRQVIVFLLGASLGSHIAGTSREAFHQYDVRQVGIFFSVMVIMIWNAFLVVLIMAMVAPSRVSLWLFLETSLRFDAWYLSALYRFLLRIT